MKSIIKFSFLFLLIGAPIFSSCKDEKKEEELAVLVDQYQKEREEARKTVDELENLYAKEKEYYYVKINVSKTPSDIKTIVSEAEKDNAIISKVKRKYYILLDELEHLAPEERVEFKKTLDAATEPSAIAAMMVQAEELSAKYIYLNDQLLKDSRFTKADGSGIIPIAEHKNKFTREELRQVVDVETVIRDKVIDEKYGFIDPIYFPNLEKAKMAVNTTKADVDISSCKKLKSVTIDGISSILIGNLPELEKFYSKSERLRSIDLSVCSNLKEFVVYDVYVLENLKLPEVSKLERLTLVGCDNLREQLDINRFKNLRHFGFVVRNQNSMKFQDPNLWDFSKMDELEYFSITGVGQKLEHLKFSSKAATKLLKLTISESNVGVVDCSNLSGLTLFHLKDAVIEKVIFPEAGGLEEISFFHLLGFTQIDFSKQNNLKRIFILDDKIKTFTDMRGTRVLENLESASFDCPDLKELDLSNSKKLKWLRVYKGTKLTLPEGKMEEEGFKLTYKDKD